MKTIHTLTIVDKSMSMNPYRGRTIEGINDNINTLKREVDGDTVILNTLLQFSSNDTRCTNRGLPAIRNETDFIFTRVGVKVENIVDMVEAEYVPGGWTPLLDAIGYGIQKVKNFHGDNLGDDNLKIIVTIYTDGEENSSKEWDRPAIKKMLDHFQSDGKWTFTFVGCGSFDNVAATSATLGISSANTVAVADSDFGRMEASAKISTSYTSYARSVKCGVIDTDLFKKAAT